MRDDRARISAFLERRKRHRQMRMRWVRIAAQRIDDEQVDALEKIDEVSLFSGRLLEAATDLFDECYAHEIPENLRTYIDYEAFANDCRCNGDMVEFRFAGEDWTCINANGI